MDDRLKLGMDINRSLVKVDERMLLSRESDLLTRECYLAGRVIF